MRLLVFLLLLPLIFGCQRTPEVSTDSGGDTAMPAYGSVPKPDPVKLASESLPNLIRWNDKVYSGGQPAGRPGFAELSSLGVRTVISVDGARPELELARQFELRYVHLPHGYDGIPRHRVLELAKAVETLPGPIYIHCHHGKHRSPAAAAVACGSLGWIEAGQAVAGLRLAGTHPKYRGLYQSVQETETLGSDELVQNVTEFKEVVELAPLAERMVELELTYSRLEELAAIGWRSSEVEDDAKAAHEALVLREHYTELLRDASLSRDAAPYDAESFIKLLKASEVHARALERELANNRLNLDERKKRFTQVQQDCIECHERIRDVPLSEKRSAVF